MRAGCRADYVNGMTREVSRVTSSVRALVSTVCGAQLTHCARSTQTRALVYKGVFRKKRGGGNCVIAGSSHAWTFDGAGYDWCTCIAAPLLPGGDSQARSRARGVDGVGEFQAYRSRHFVEQVNVELAKPRDFFKPSYVVGAAMSVGDHKIALQVSCRGRLLMSVVALLLLRSRAHAGLVVHVLSSSSRATARICTCTLTVLTSRLSTARSTLPVRCSSPPVLR